MELYPALCAILFAHDTPRAMSLAGKLVLAGRRLGHFELTEMCPTSLQATQYTVGPHSEVSGWLLPHVRHTVA